MACTAELSDAEQMQSAVEKIYQRFGAIDGVMHAESVSGTGLIQFKTPETITQALRRVVKGALVLESVLKARPHGFLVLCSSITSVVAGFGQADECAASAFLDALAQSKRADDGPPTLSIDWGLWKPDGQEQAAPVAGPLHDSLRELRETYGLTFEEGTLAFERILPTSLPQVVVSTYDLRAIVERQQALTTASFFKKAEALQAAAPAHQRPALNNAYVPPRNPVESIIVEVWQRLFGIEPIGVEDNFFELGGHSLLAVQLVTRIREALQADLPLQSLYEYPTVAGLASLITEQQLSPAEMDEVDQLFMEIESLSPEEVQEQLARAQALEHGKGKRETFV
jgi:acyl carrier protein